MTRKLAERELRPDVSHPDADLLTAFVECALPERDRGTVLRHLADCPSCREIVALAQPAEVAADTVIFPPRSRSRLAWLRWGALAACAVLAVSFAMLRQRQPGDAPLLAKNQASAPSSEQRSMAPAADKAVLGDADQGDAGRGVANQLTPAAPAAASPQEQKSEAPAMIAGHDAETAQGIHSKAKRALAPLARAPSLMRAPSPMNDSAGFVANGEVSSSNVTTQNFGLPLNGRSVSQLSRLAPRVGAGAQVGGVMGASSAAQPSAADVKAGPVKVAKEKADESDEAVRAQQPSLVYGDALKTADAAPRTRSLARAARTGNEGEIRGLVTDPSGAVVSGANVTITNTATGLSLASTTNLAGRYGVSSVPAGPYTIAISKAGFQDFVRSGVNVEPSTVALNATLTMGAVSEAVTVEGRAASVDTTSATTSPTTAYAPNDKDAFRASSEEMANLPNLVAARQAGIWQISAAGNLERSFDGGKSWESVPVVPAGVNPPARLRVVAATGFQVWVGGNTGVLLHSQDAGSRFTNVKVHKKHFALTGDIVALAFSDAEHGRLETADHDVWTTTDGGKTWRPDAGAK